MNLSYLRNGRTLAMEATSCTGCGTCADVCPHAVWDVTGVVARIAHRERCMECGACALNCPEGAITVRAGVGCATAVLNGLLRKTSPSCGCSGPGTECGG